MKAFLGGSFAIEGISHDGVTEFGEMDSNLVSSSSVGANQQMSEMTKSLQWSVGSFRWAFKRAFGAHFFSVNSVSSNGIS
jgi:hypothetical protein